MVSSQARVGSINVLFEVQYAGAIAGTNRLANEVVKGGDRMQRSVQSTDRTVLGLNTTMARLNARQFNVLALSALRMNNSVDRLRGTLLATSALLGGFGAAFTLKGLTEYSDTYKTVGNRLRVVKGEAQDLRDVEKDIFDVAQRSRSQYEATGILFARMANASKRLGISQKDVLRTTETIQKAFVLGGATPTEAQQSSLQLSQGIASNRLQGDELRSVLENPALGQLLADRISGGDIGKLREMAAQGELTAGVIIKAFRDASGEIDALFANTDQTIGQAFVRIDNALIRYIGTSDKVNASSRATITLLNAIADNFDSVAESVTLLAAAGLSVLGGRGITGITGWASGLKASAAAARDNAAANLQMALAEKTSAAQTLASTRAAYEMAKANTVSASTRTRLGKELQAASLANALATKRAAAATLEHGAALKAASLSGMAFATAGRVASSAWAFIGGPFGAALLAISAVMFIVGKKAQDAQERSDRYAAAIEKAGDKSEGAAPGIREAASSLDLVAKSATKAEKQVALATAKSDLAEFFLDMSAAVQRLGAKIGGWNSVAMQRDLQGLRKQFQDGDLTLDQFLAKLDEISEKNPDASNIISEIQRLAREAEAARGVIDGLNKATGEIGGASGKGDRLRGLGRSQNEFDEASPLFRRMHPETLGTKDSLEDSARKGANEAISGFVDRIIKAESGGDRFAKNSRSSASGLGQFIDSTWIDQFRKVYSDAKNMTDAQILAFKSTEDVSRKLIDNYARENAATLQRAGIAVQGAADEYKLQLAHFLGPQGAIKVLTAAPGTPVAGLLDKKQIAANPEVLGGGATVDDVIAYGQKRAGMTTALTEDADLRAKQKKAIDDTIASLQRQTEATNAETESLGKSQYDRLRYLYALQETQRLEEQGITLTKDQKDAIQAKADALAAATVAQDAATDAQRRSNEEMEFNKGLMKDVLSGLRYALEDGKITWQELGDIALSVLDKIIDKIEDQLINALFDASSAGSGIGGSSGGGGGLLGWAVKGIGSLLGFSFHGGGTVGVGGNVVQFPSGAPYVGKFHGGGNFGGQRAKHDEVMALVQEKENIFTGGQTDRIIGALQSNMASIKDGGQIVRVEVVGSFVDDRGVIQGKIEKTSSAAVQSGLSQYDKGLPGRISDVMERHG